MAFLNYVSGYAGSIGFTAVAFIIALTVVVFIHELGHFLVGRWSGARIDVFSIGFGREIVGWTDRHGTRWKIAMLPLGGYVKFAGDENEASQPDAAALAAMSDAERGQTLAAKSLPWRAAVIAAGPIANFILAAVIFSGLSYAYGRTVILPRVGMVMENSAAADAGIRKGDTIRSIDGVPIASFFDIAREVSERAGEPVTVGLERDGQRIELKLVPRVLEERYQATVVRRGVIGLRSSDDPADRIHVPVGLGEAVVNGSTQVWDIIAGSVRGLAGLATGRTQTDQISGTIGVATLVGNVASRGLPDFISIIAFVSVSIGFLNLLPIPVLDGGHLLFILIEAVRRGKPLPDRAMEWSFRIGLALILGLAVFAFSNDIRNLVAYLATKSS